MTARRAVVGTCVVLAAWLVAFFVTFNLLFSDGPTSLIAGERLVSYAIVAIAHGLLAAAGSRWAGITWLTWAIVAVAPSLLVSVLYASRESNIAALAAIDLVIAAGAAVGAAWLARPKGPDPN